MSTNSQLALIIGLCVVVASYYAFIFLWHRLGPFYTVTRLPSRRYKIVRNDPNSVWLIIVQINRSDKESWWAPARQLSKNFVRCFVVNPEVGGIFDVVWNWSSNRENWFEKRIAWYTPPSVVALDFDNTSDAELTEKGKRQVEGVVSGKIKTRKATAADFGK